MTVDNVVNRTALAALTSPTGKTAFLMEYGRAGLFDFRSGNFAAAVAADPQQGLYVASSSVSTSSGCWARVWDNIHGIPEWFGATADVSTVDNSAAIQACIDLCPITMLRAAKYYIGTSISAVGSYCLRIQIDGRQLIGVAATQRGSATATELIINSSVASGVLVGFDTAPPHGPDVDWVQDARVEDLTIRRNTSSGYPIGNPSSGTANAPTGLKLQYAAICKVKNVWTVEHSFGFHSAATVACVYNGCRALRFSAGTSPGNDFWAGYWQDNSVATPYASGNASLYYLQCGAFSNAPVGGAPAYTYNGGLKTNQGFTDTYVVQFEASNVGYGIDAQGRSSTAIDDQTEDLIITDPVLDGVRFAGIRIQFGGPKTAVQIKGHYIGCSSATGPTTKGIAIESVNGSVTITGGQTIGASDNSATGLNVFQSSGVVSIGNIYTDMVEPIVLDQVVNFRLMDHVNVAQVSFAQAVKVSASTRGTIDCDVATSNGSVAIGKGINLVGTGNSRIKAECTNIDATYMTGGSANKLVNNGISITATGMFGSTCLAQGIMT